MDSHLGIKIFNQIQALSEEFVEEDILILERMNVQQQEGCDDCGLFAVAFATELAFGKDPTHCCHEQKKKRKHLL